MCLFCGTVPHAMSHMMVTDIPHDRLLNTEVRQGCLLLASLQVVAFAVR